MRVAFALGALLAVGCGNPFIVTDTFTPLPEGAFATPPNQLHDYVVGARFGIRVRASRSFVDLDSVEIVSKDPSLLVVEEQIRVDDEIHASLHAVAAGTTGLDFLDAQKRPLEERVLEVKLPDEIALAVDMDTDRGYTIPVLEPDALLVAAGGSVTFRVSYRADGAEIVGNDVLRSTGDSAVTVDNPILAEPDREFLTLTAPATPSDFVDVPLVVAGETIRTLRVQPAPLEAIASIELDEGAVPAVRGDGERATIWAKAFDEGATPIFGVRYEWTLESAAVDGSGDLITYAFASGQRRRIQVVAGDAVRDLTVEAAAGSALVSSTARAAGCANAAGAPVLVVLALVLRRRRRSSALL